MLGWSRKASRVWDDVGKAPGHGPWTQQCWPSLKKTVPEGVGRHKAEKRGWG